jgi:hypothetical protein
MCSEITAVNRCRSRNTCK